MSQQEIKRVWIEEGCISCNLCAEICAEVFLVEESMDCVIKPGASSHFAGKAEEIIQATEDCPVEVIKHEAVISECGPASEPPGTPLREPPLT